MPDQAKKNRFAHHPDRRSRVRDNVLLLSSLLRDAFREATAGRDALAPVTVQLKVVLREMRE